MMVLASVYFSVFASLTTTANINLAYPVLVIMVNVVLQVSLAFQDHKNITYYHNTGYGEEDTEKKEITKHIFFVKIFKIFLF